MKRLLLAIVLLMPPLSPSAADSPTRDIEADVCVYTASPAGILAAIAVKSTGKSVVIVEPSRWVGGILGSGIKPIQDCPNFEAVGGTTRELMSILGTGDTEPLSAQELRARMRSTSPKQIREDFLRVLREHDISVVFDHRIRSVHKPHAAIIGATFDLAPVDETGCPTPLATQPRALKIRAQIYIDASYDGELMARSGVSYVTGRESAFSYQETSAGVGPATNVTPLDPYLEIGNPKSGLLPLINDPLILREGAGDHYTQAYNFRYYVTADPEHRAPFPVPADYQPSQYELVGRYVEYLKRQYSDPSELTKRLSWIFPGWMNAGEYNYHRRSLITMAPVGISHLYANGDYATKSRIWKQHQRYLIGLWRFMSTDARLPKDFRDQTAALGLDRRHHPETQGWPHQLYIRVSRRLAGSYTITSHDVYNQPTVNDPIALAQYGIDTYPARRVWFEKDGQTFVALEGNMFVGGPKGPTNVPYPVPYRAITPKASECQNLLVPVCFSATHLGYASARMEPVFMMCGESAGIAAAQAIDQAVPVQQIDMRRFQEQLQAIGQKLSW